MAQRDSLQFSGSFDTSHQQGKKASAMFGISNDSPIGGQHLQNAHSRVQEALLQHESFIAEMNEVLQIMDDVTSIKEWFMCHLPSHDFSVRQKLRQSASLIGRAVTDHVDGAYPFSGQASPTNMAGMGLRQASTVMLNIQSSYVSSMHNLNNLFVPGNDEDAASERAVSIGRVSRVGSVRAGSFYGGKKRGMDALSDMYGIAEDSQNGEMKFMPEGLADTYSLASKGSYRRRQTLHQVAEATVVGNNGSMRRSRALCGNMEGMPGLDIDLDVPDLHSAFSRPTQRHTAVFTSDADYESMLDECCTPRIFDISSTEFNVFEEFLRYGNSAFAVIATNIILRYRFVQTLAFNIRHLMNFVRTVQSFYRNDNPFHNALHAADVMQTTHLYLCQRDVKENFSDVELFSLLFAAMVIDIGHLGVNNQFLIKTRHPISTLFSDNSPLEAMHAALAFCILEDPDCNFLSVSLLWDRDTDSDFRYLVTNFIFNTDHAKHTDLLTSVTLTLSRGKVTNENTLELLSAILHAADISYLSKPRHIFLEWSFRMLAENYRQGEAEVEFARNYVSANNNVEIDPNARWLQISTLCDKNKSIGTEVIRQMMELVVVPFLTIIRSVLPSVWIDRMEANLAYLLEGGEDKQAIIIAGVQDHLWRKGVAPVWNDVDVTTGKNFLQVIRSWIATELSDEEVPSPSKIVAGQPRHMSSEDQSSYSMGSQRASHNPALLGDTPGALVSFNDVNPFTAQLNPPSPPDDPVALHAAGATEALGASGVGQIPAIKKRLSISHSRVSTPGGIPLSSLGLKAVHVLSSEMLRHMHTLVESNTSDAFDPIREAAIFATQWIKVMKDLEEQENGPVLLSSLATHSSRNTMSGSFSPAEKDEALQLIEVLRDLSSPVAYFKAVASARGSTSVGDKRPSFNELLTSNAPFGVAVLLTQMWWILIAALEQKEDPLVRMGATPVEGIIDDDRSDAGSDNGHRMSSTMVINRTLDYVNQTAKALTQPDLTSSQERLQSPLLADNSPPEQQLVRESSQGNTSAGEKARADPPRAKAASAPPAPVLSEAEVPRAPVAPAAPATAGPSPTTPPKIEAPSVASPQPPVQPHTPAPHPSPLRYILQRKQAQARPSPLR